MIRFIKRYRLEIFLFFVEAVCMALELCASRTLSPYFGDSNMVWTGIIGIILLSGSIGNSVGGKIADREHDDIASKRKLGNTTILAAALILYIPVLSPIILTLVSVAITSREIAVILGTVLLFLPSSLAFGTIPPQIMKRELRNLDHAGKTAGKLQAVSAVGSIFGTFMSGFILVPHFGSRNILFALAAFTALLAFLAAGRQVIKHMCLLAVIAVACIVVVTQYNADSASSILNGEEGIIAEYDTQYSHVVITNELLQGEPVRYMLIGNGCESATYTDDDMKYDLAVPYTRYYDLMFDADISVENILMIGGGGYSYPKYCVSHHEGTSIDVVEIDGQITELAKEYFFLEDALEEFNTDGTNRLNLIQEDGKVYISTSGKRYDAVLNDAFSGMTPVESLTTLESVQQIHDMLNPGGVYLSNVIGSRSGDGSDFLQAEVNTIAQVFDYVYVVPCADDGQVVSETDVENHMVIASDFPLDIEEAIPVDLSGSLVLTDDYCPIDSLIPNER